MLQKLKAMRASKKGFTLAELLIVVAIIAILAAIAIPVFASQLNDARLKVDMANARSANSIAVADYMLHNHKDSVEYTFGVDTLKGLGIQSVSNGVTCSAADPNLTALTPSSSEKSGTLTVTVNGGKVTDNSWKDWAFPK